MSEGGGRERGVSEGEMEGGMEGERQAIKKGRSMGTGDANGH